MRYDCLEIIPYKTMNPINANQHAEKELINSKALINEQLVDGVIEQLNDKCAEVNISKTNFKRIRYIAIELLQNVIKYALTHHNQSVCDFRVTEEKDAYIIQCQNTVSLQQKQHLNANLMQLNSLSQSELKEHYMSALTNTKFNAEGGAGLGFMSILLKSSNPFKIDFEPISLSHYQFKITTFLSIEN